MQKLLKNQCGFCVRPILQYVDCLNIIFNGDNVNLKNKFQNLANAIKNLMSERQFQPDNEIDLQVPLRNFTGEGIKCKTERQVRRSENKAERNQNRCDIFLCPTNRKIEPQVGMIIECKI